ncbi:Uma2 family endonuclease [Arsenicibacter rosenii]|uniref:Putative restriction endonuclease domain-containing protein n=1 Tax=Arsenicibacter rosenii TaxID=1750698 RepID=A0A1S2VG93_9BACT|nr:Uma2 family endonuclease [Arsenicibacter rosenii]OIN57729.1 hypothetical protein BLX24_18470 [Arsenicibacter rosenii]
MEVIRELSEYELERDKHMPSKNHGKLQYRISKAIGDLYEDRFDILTEVSLDIPSRPLVPDIALFAVKESDWLEDEIKVKEPPLGIAEILSPTQGNQELVDKMETYFSFGIKSCWIVIPTFQMIHVFSDKHTYKTYMQNELYDEILDIRLDLKRIFR